MDDKKLNNNNNPSENEDSNIDYLTKQAKESKFEFGSAGHDDINKNLGSFGDTKVKAEEAQAPEIKLDVDAKVVEKASQEKINFERFKKTKHVEKAAKTKFGEKVSIMLRSKKGFRTTWIIEMVSMAVIIILSSILIGLLTRYKTATEGSIVDLKMPLQVGLVFCWISLFPCLIPLVYLVTSWFVGINQVASSRLFHYMFWIFGIISVLCFIIGLCCLIAPINAVIQYPPF